MAHHRFTPRADFRTVRLIAELARVDPRTVAHYLDGRRGHRRTREMVEEALTRAGRTDLLATELQP